MGINISTARNQASKASEYASELRIIRQSLLQYQSNLQLYWKSDEMVYINRAIDNMIEKINSASIELYKLGNEIYNAADAVKRAEELAAAKANALSTGGGGR